MKQENHKRKKHDKEIDPRGRFVSSDGDFVLRGKRKVEEKPINLVHEAFKRNVYATDGFETVRTEVRSVEEDGVPFVGYIKLSEERESEVSYDNETLVRTMIEGHEITEEQYRNV